MPPSRVTMGEPLCCCEYENIKGERSHILACCCDCEAVDQAFERCLTCQEIPIGMRKKIFDTISDRCRCPGIFGSGATKVRLDIVVPIVAVPLCITLATIGPIMTGLSLTFMPLFMFSFYKIWRKNVDKPKTPFFFVWGLVSVVLMFCIFQGFIVAFREILLWENILLSSAFFLMLYYLVIAKSKMPSLRPYKTYRTRNRQIFNNGRDSFNSNAISDHKGSSFTQINMEGNGMIPAKTFSLENLTSVPEEDVKWLDSRPFENGKLSTWCNECGIKRPPRSGHCSVCNTCIEVRDHHCVWIDCCIGAHNHRPFMAAMILFVFCGVYGAHLTMTTVCTPQMYFGWFLLPNDCRFLYVDFQTAVSFVSGCYSLMAATFMTFNLTYQCILIAQNVTSHEMHRARQRNLTRCYGLVAIKNVHNNGFFRNCWKYLMTKRTNTTLIQV